MKANGKPKAAKPAVTREQAIALLQEEERAKQQAFSEAYVKLCQEHGYELQAVSNMRIIPLPKQ